ncbi:MAG: ChrB, partial [Proteobacteria bacterium]|nr:ChrB [Pseudomonadota bacterium]
RPWVDRLASAWLIKRFIDPKARIVWLKDPKTCPRRALGFDFDGAVFTHVGARVTFEVLLASFALEDDKGLERLGQLVHYLDVGGVPVPEAAGLETILNGARRQHADDDRLLAEAAKTFDYLYNAFSQK